jgi:predicted transport protein
MLSALDRSVRPARKLFCRMWIAHVICSGRDCTEDLEVVIEDLEELDSVACTCGHGYVLLSVSAVDLV